MNERLIRAPKVGGMLSDLHFLKKLLADRPEAFGSFEDEEVEDLLSSLVEDPPPLSPPLSSELALLEPLALEVDFSPVPGVSGEAAVPGLALQPLPLFGDS